MKFNAFVLPSLALGAAALLFAPGEESLGFSTIHSGLPANTQRDLRVRNIFADSQANNNLTPDPQFPGWQGADMALWKGMTEWGSVLHGGTGGLGEGGANFDFSWQGAASGSGASGTYPNVMSVLSSCGGGGTLAFVLTTGGNSGWIGKFCDDWSWSDGPGNATGGRFDIQGVGTHEFGHALGLGHTFSGNVMVASTPNGNNQRNLGADDKAGVQFIYGAMSASKPEITGLTVDMVGNTVTISGTNFAATGNEVWFTNKNLTSAGSGTDPRVRVTGVTSTAGNITVGVPADAGPGDVMVKTAAGSNGNTLSNAWPADVLGNCQSPPLEILSITPSVVDNLIPGTGQTITISGNSFPPSTVIELDGTPITTAFTRVSDTTMTFDMPQTTLGAHTIAVVDGAESDTEPMTVNAPSSPILQAGTGDDLNIVFTASGIDIIQAGPVGTVQILVAATSPLPSMIPGFICLDIGNNLTQDYNLGAVIIGGDGAVTQNIPVSGVALLGLYFQTFTLPIPVTFPLCDTSNVQSVLVNF